MVVDPVGVADARDARMVELGGDACLALDRGAAPFLG
jgi:hypothetical protein